MHCFKRTAFDIPIAIFLGTALVGVWAAYNRGAARVKFWWIVAAVLLYFVLARQPKANIWLVVGLTISSGFVLALFLLLTYRRTDQPVKIGLAN